MKGLIVTADDFGAALEVNDAVEAAHLDGILTAASLMIGAPAAADAVLRARRLPRLRVGLHVVLTEGRPLLPPSVVSQLVDDHGTFRSDLAKFGMHLMLSAAARRQLKAEMTAQFEAFRATGLAIDHCNAHMHFHLHPVVGSLLSSIGARFATGAIRVPSEPARVLRRIEKQPAYMRSQLINPFNYWLRKSVARRGLIAADHVFGFRWSGHMTTKRLSGLIRHLPVGLNEVYLHPATGAYTTSAAGYQYREELTALMASEVIEACRDGGLQLGGYSDFQATAGLLRTC